jgi:broad specificity phosphatase PhoE
MRIQQITQKIKAHHTTPHPATGKSKRIQPADTVKRRHSSGSSFHQQLFIEQQTGHLCIEAPTYELRFPMIVVRHGQTNGNIKRQFQGQIDKADHALNAVGREQVRQGAHRLYERLHGLFGEQLAEVLRSGNIVLLHSPLSRARDTAWAFIDHVAEQTGITLPATAEQRLSEMSFGILEGHSIDEVVEDVELHEHALRYRAEDASVDWKGTGESYLDVVLRAHELLEALTAQYAGKNVLVIAFSHGIAINALRTVLRDPALVAPDGVVAFRKHILDNAEAYWLGESRPLAERIFTMGM